jgi:hypothetical protein
MEGFNKYLVKVILGTGTALGWKSFPENKLDALRQDIKV